MHKHEICGKTHFRGPLGEPAIDHGMFLVRQSFAIEVRRKKLLCAIHSPYRPWASSRRKMQSRSAPLI